MPTRSRLRTLNWLIVAGLLLGLTATSWAQDESQPQEPVPPASTADRAQERQEKREQLRQRIQELQEQAKADREAYRQAVEQHGQDSPEAQAARAKLRQDMAEMRRIRDRVQDRQMDRRRDRRREHRLRPNNPGRSAGPGR